ncbi:MAG: ribonuclease HII [Parcubacteria group bacterium Gr01-1014_20]|nr:MAG: ribonuclease HII [Parcubacteria group bacterium Gr01-1014_20]
MKYVIGLDEVGRGSLAGPVVVAAVLIPKGLRIMNYELGIMKDSKKVNSQKREKWFRFFKNHPDVLYTLARVYPKKIDQINISNAANLAALHAYERLVSGIIYKVPDVYLDGGLYLGGGKNRIPAKTVIRGDEKITAIKIASIIAKVSRDKFMARLAKKYPKYNFETHKGYGTKRHIQVIKKFGPLIVHRRSFLRFI